MAATARRPLADLPGALVVLLVALTGCTGGEEPAPPPEPGRALRVSSEAFEDGESLPARHTCDGQDMSPPLAWGDVPAGAAELAVLVEDPDAPGGVFVHWVGAGIDPGNQDLTEGEAPPVEGRNDFDEVGYRGPCPPQDDEAHRYVFTVFAADRALELPAGASADDLRERLEGAELARGQITGHYGR